MSEFIIYEEAIPIKSTVFTDVSVKASIDKGSTLTKIAFVTPDSRQDADRVTLRCLTFHNDHFMEAIHTLKQQAQLPREGTLRVTGVGVSTYRDKIKEVFGLEAAFVMEMVTIGFGPYTLINNSDPDDIFFPIPDFRTWTFESEMLEKILQKAADKVESSDDKFPALILYVGSGCGVMKVEKDGHCSMVMGSGLSGRPLMGLSHALIGTADYDELMHLADKGDYHTTDWTAGDMLDEDPDSPYGRFPRDMPVFPFGKAASKAWNRASASRADLALSLLRLLSTEVGILTFNAVSSTGLNKVYICGNFFRHELPRKLYYENIHTFFSFLTIDVKFIKSGNTGALAAMVLDPEECKKLM